MSETIDERAGFEFRSANVRLMALSDRLSEKSTQRKIIDMNLSYVL